MLFGISIVFFPVFVIKSRVIMKVIKLKAFTHSLLVYLDTFLAVEFLGKKMNDFQI